MSESLHLQAKELQMQHSEYYNLVPGSTPSLPPSTVKYTESHDSLQSVKQELQTLQKEHTEYKVKAAGILQVKKRDR